MARQIEVAVERRVSASPEQVMALLADYRQGRPRILTDNYVDYTVEQGGQGAGTVVRYTFRAARRERRVRLQVETPDPETIVETDTNSSLVTTWRVTPEAGGSASRVRLLTTWQGAGGLGGFFERTFAPRGLRRVYAQVLDRLEAAVRR